MYVCMYVCMSNYMYYVCMHVSMYLSVYVMQVGVCPMYIRVRVYLCLCLSLCLWVCLTCNVLAEEFESLARIGTEHSKLTSAQHPTQNRYSNICAYDHRCAAVHASFLIARLVDSLRASVLHCSDLCAI
jgi:hypothetical protein